MEDLIKFLITSNIGFSFYEQAESAPKIIIQDAKDLADEIISIAGDNFKITRLNNGLILKTLDPNSFENELLKLEQFHFKQMQQEIKMYPNNFDVVMDRMRTYYIDRKKLEKEYNKFPTISLSEHNQKIKELNVKLGNAEMLLDCNKNMPNTSEYSKEDLRDAFDAGVEFNISDGEGIDWLDFLEKKNRLKKKILT